MHGCQWTDRNVWEGGVCAGEGLRVCRSWSATVMYHSCHGQGCKGCMCESQCYIRLCLATQMIMTLLLASLTVSYIPNIHNVQERSTTKGIASLSLQRLHNTVACKAEVCLQSVMKGLLVALFCEVESSHFRW